VKSNFGPKRPKAASFGTPSILLLTVSMTDDV
jgi:hypothetical protein